MGKDLRPILKSQKRVTWGQEEWRQYCPTQMVRQFWGSMGRILGKETLSDSTTPVQLVIPAMSKDVVEHPTKFRSILKKSGKGRIRFGQYVHKKVEGQKTGKQ